MIKRIDIKNFGLFSNFDWRVSFRDGQKIHEFDRFNILYGRNYSGKTTLARIVRSFETGRLPENYQLAEFCLGTDNGTLNQSELLGHSLDIRVYNTDFVDENLSFLNNPTAGGVETFAILGSTNKEVETLIKEKQKELGDTQAKQGLLHELADKQTALTAKETLASDTSAAFDEQLRRYANDVIKNDRTFGTSNYNIRRIEEDMEFVKQENFNVLDESEVKRCQNQIKEEALERIHPITAFSSSFSTMLDDASDALHVKITPSVPIQELLNDVALQSWVREGITHHKGKRSECGFCRQPLPSDLWVKLNSHFNEESLNLENELNCQIQAFEKEEALTVQLRDKECFYLSLHDEHTRLHGELFDALKTHRWSAKNILEQLRSRKKNIFKVHEIPDVTNVTPTIQSVVGEINALIQTNNATSIELPKLRERAVKKLRLNAVAKFMRDIHAEAENKRIQELEDEVTECKRAFESIQQKVKLLQTEIKRLQAEFQDERRGAESVNKYLNHLLGYEGLRLDAIEQQDDTSSFKFQIMRGVRPAYNMSEGEKSIVAFCYFMARLDDTETKDKNLIIYIDDPVSSLDSNHIFFVFSLIESCLARPMKNDNGSDRYRYKQLFISTHNLEFFRYLTRLSIPNPKQTSRKFFLVERDSIRSSIRKMPKYLKDYQTEFHYLFHQIYRCSNSQQLHENHEVFYNFGNNLRKFLEAYLFYKYPYKSETDSSTTRLLSFFGNDETATALTNRISNEMSHLEKVFDRSMRPIDVAELPAVASFVLDKMYEKDSEQFNALLQSIGVPKRKD